MNQNREFLFTVFTPTYNRAHTLNRVYESLRRQTFHDFEWLIVDDGSTDNTRELVESWQSADNYFPIRYIWQENAHKKSAFNRGVKEARGTLFLTWDSDDEAVPDALKILNDHWNGIPEPERNNYSAVTGLCVDAKGVVVGERFSRAILDSDSVEIRYRYKIAGDKWGFQRTDVLREFPFPQNVQGHVPEGVVWSAIASRYKTRFVNDVLLINHREPDSITVAGATPDVVGKNAEGHALWAREVLSNELRCFCYDPKWFLKMAANYTRFHLHLKNRKRWPLRGILPRVLVMLMWPVGVVRYLIDIRKN